MASTLAKDHGANAAAGRGGGAIRTWEVGFTEPRALGARQLEKNFTYHHDLFSVGSRVFIPVKVIMYL